MAGSPGADRHCEKCGDRIPDHARRDAVYCSRACKVAARKARRKTEVRGVTRHRGDLPLESYEEGGYPSEGGYPDDEGAGSPSAAQRMASTRFQRMLSHARASVASVVPVELRDAQRRNPGVTLREIRDLELDAADADRERSQRLRDLALDGRVPFTPQDRFRDPEATRDAFTQRARASRAAASRVAVARSTSAPRPRDYADARQWASASTAPQPAPSGGFGRRLPARYVNAGYR